MLERSGRRDGEQSAPDEDVTDEPTTVIVCARCRTELTTRDQRLEIEGSHAHTFTNPAGETFHLRCFGEVRNLAALGKPETFFTWFAGHSWRIVVCASCATFLGWRFEGTSVFHGLIHDRIAG
jgi:hypothetical protein